MLLLGALYKLYVASTKQSVQYCVPVVGHKLPILHMEQNGVELNSAQPFIGSFVFSEGIQSFLWLTEADRWCHNICPSQRKLCNHLENTKLFMIGWAPLTASGFWVWDGKFIYHRNIVLYTLCSWGYIQFIQHAQQVHLPSEGNCLGQLGSNKLVKMNVKLEISFQCWFTLQSGTGNPCSMHAFRIAFKTCCVCYLQMVSV